VRVLKGHQITVEALATDMTVDGHTYRAGETIAVSLDQPQSTYLETLWRAQLEFEENVFYDVSTWTLPWAFNLTHTRSAVQRAATEPWAERDLGQTTGLAPSAVGYLIDWRDSASPSLLYDLLEIGANVRVAEATFTALTAKEGPVNFTHGTLFVAPKLQENVSDAVISRLQRAKAEGIAVYSATSSYTPEGIDLGSRAFTVLSLPKVLLVTGPDTSAYNIGEIWHLLDTRVGMPVTMVDSHRLSRVSLGDYSHVIMASPLRASSMTQKLKTFVEDGGVLWAQGASTITWAADQGLTNVTWRTMSAQGTAKGGTHAETQGLLRPKRKPFGTASDEYAFTLVRGAILQGELDVTHPLGFGYESSQLPVFRTSNRFMNHSANPYSTPLAYTKTPLLSGYMSSENQDVVANSAGLVVDQRGAGAVVLSLDSPTFRAFWWGTQRLLVNGIFFGDLLEEPR
jgi:hypothetical protein